MRTPSSRNVLIRQRRATCGRYCFVTRRNCGPQTLVRLGWGRPSPARRLPGAWDSASTPNTPCGPRCATTQGRTPLHGAVGSDRARGRRFALLWAPLSSQHTRVGGSHSRKTWNCHRTQRFLLPRRRRVRTPRWQRAGPRSPHDLGPGRSLLRRPALKAVQQLPWLLLTRRHQQPPPPTVTAQICLQTLPHVPWGEAAKPPPTP